MFDFGCSMTAKDARSESYQKTGRRPQGEINTPRDKTICFMVSEDEKAAVDALGLATNRTRSATLAKMVTLFLGSVEGEEAARDKAEEELWIYIEECREKIKEAPGWVKSVSQQSITSK